MVHKIIRLKENNEIEYYTRINDFLVGIRTSIKSINKSKARKNKEYAETTVRTKKDMIKTILNSIALVNTLKIKNGDEYTKLMDSKDFYGDIKKTMSLDRFDKRQKIEKKKIDYKIVYQYK